MDIGMKSGWLIGALVIAAAGCAHEEGLVPGPQARVVPGWPKLAYAEKSGVEVLVDGDAWKGNPRDLEKVMTPSRVTVRLAARLDPGADSN